MGEPNERGRTLLQDARKSFRLASEAKGPEDIERFAASGRDYLQLAHKAAEVKLGPSQRPRPGLWRLP